MMQSFWNFDSIISGSWTLWLCWTVGETPADVIRTGICAIRSVSDNQPHLMMSCAWPVILGSRFDWPVVLNEQQTDISVKISKWMIFGLDFVTWLILSVKRTLTSHICRRATGAHYKCLVSCCQMTSPLMSANCCELPMFTCLKEKREEYKP